MNMDVCPICGAPADTKEHIIPKWLQREYDLKNQRLGLHNGTTINYNQAVIPICQQCNGGTLATLEAKIQQGSGSKMDYYIWALKIRYFLSIKDSRLLIDRSDASKGTVIDVSQTRFGIEFITNALLNACNDKFTFAPNPFGSVFVIDDQYKRTDFGLFDLPNPYWALSVTLPQNKILVVLFTDRGMVRRSLLSSFKSEDSLLSYFQSLFKNSTMEGLKLLMFVTCIRQHRISNIPKIFKLYGNGIVSEAPDELVYSRSVDKYFVYKMARRFQYDDEFALGIANQLG